MKFCVFLLPNYEKWKFKFSKNFRRMYAALRDIQVPCRQSRREHVEVDLALRFSHSRKKPKREEMAKFVRWGDYLSIFVGVPSHYTQQQRETRENALCCCCCCCEQQPAWLSRGQKDPMGWYLISSPSLKSCTWICMSWPHFISKRWRDGLGSHLHSTPLDTFRDSSTTRKCGADIPSNW